MLSTLKSMSRLRLIFVTGALLVVVLLILGLGQLVSINGITPLQSLESRAFIAVLVPSGYMLLLQGRQMLESGVNAKMTQALTGVLGQGSARVATGISSVKYDEAPGKEEVELLNRRFKDALAILKKRRFIAGGRRRWLYQLPWYVVIGPPGAGKTTAIVNSGLTFPLADRFGRKALGGVGGTRHCDWWFTDDAVIIDTAGRYTTRESNREQDGVAWLGFLKLLKHYRRHQPLNGILVAIGISDLIGAGDEVRQAHAASIRQRIDELYRELELRLPVYVMFTKADLVAGFSEYFDDLGKEGREAVWGSTLQLRDPEPPEGYAAEYPHLFDNLIGRLDTRLLDRMQHEADPQRRALIFGFPQQMASLKDLLQQFIDEVFEPNSFDEAILLRGVYFASGTQSGTPLDRVMASMARMFAISPPPLPALADNKRSYFLTNLLRQVVFKEAGLADAAPEALRRRRRLRFGLLALMATAVLLLGGWMLGVYVKNVALVHDVASRADAYAQAAAPLHPERVADADLRQITLLLNQLRDLDAEVRGGQGGLLPLAALDQRGKLGTQTRSTYARALSSLLVPRLVLRLESELSARQGDPAFLYPGLKAYLMLGGQGPVDRQFLLRWLTLDIGTAYPGDADVALREALRHHVESLLGGPFGTVSLDGDLIARVRDILHRTPLAERAVTMIVNSPEALVLPPWRPSDHAGPSAGSVMQRRSGAAFVDGIAGIYTQAGYRQVFAPMLAGTVSAILKERWVVDGDAATLTDADADATARLERDATALYLQEFGLRWDSLLGDVTIKPIKSLDDSLRTLNVLSAPTSPIRLLIASAAQETTFAPASPSPAAAAGTDGNQNKGGDRATTTSLPAASPAIGTPPDQLSDLFRGRLSVADSPIAMAEQYGQAHFSALHGLVEVPANSQTGAAPPIDRAIDDLGLLYRSLNDLKSNPLRPADGRAAAMAQIKATAGNLPSPVKDWLFGVSDDSASLSQDDLRHRLTELWRRGAGQFCMDATKNRYPFAANAAVDMPLGDFGRLFARDGAIDTFVKETLAPYVDMSGSAWRWRDPSEGGFDGPKDALKALQRAAAIRDTMFARGGGLPALGLQLRIVAMNAATRGVSVNIGGQTIDLQPDAPATRRVVWPVDGGTDRASVTLASDDGAPASTILEEGPWALFRLIDRAQRQRTGVPGLVRARFRGEGREATVQIQADSTQTPFDGEMLASFQCPTGF
ncbi:type VI secretion system protein ImpL [Arboricoccus pini]|uniref:Type VI secretion system protein ImpL n=1 Tax=Arboricoccus pini TaxID=1963835 RepID=A0A212RQ97_9PROT|nr:type VI secretion system membrane subunit TssM [Arboricoccus pini]SNB74735.1 type VI secretion system protein ImpL [Arboricoccus pini]